MAEKLKPPKKAKNAYMFWMIANFDSLRKPDMSDIEIITGAAAEWRKLTDLSKWEAMAAEDKERFEAEMIEYKKTLPEPIKYKNNMVELDSRKTSIKDISTFINFNNFYPQILNMPKFVMDYILKNCKVFLFRKLMMACKYFRIRQIREGFCFVKNIFIYAGVNLVDEGFKDRDYGFSMFHLFDRPLKISCNFKKIKVFGKFELSNGAEMHPQMKEFIDKLDFSELSELVLEDWSITDAMRSKILLSNFLKNIYLDAKDKILFFQIFETLVNLKEFECHVELNAADFKKLIAIKRTQKLSTCSLNFNASEIDPELLFQFMKTHITSNGTFRLNLSENNEYYEKVKALYKEKKESGEVSSGLILEYDCYTLELFYYDDSD